MLLNESAKRLFGELNTDDVSPIDGYDIEKKTDPYGREYYSVAKGCFRIKENSDLSWDEWDGNETYISGNNPKLLYANAIEIMKSWKAQMQEMFPDEHFVIFASYDDGSLMAPECDPVGSFTLRFWKIREGQGPDENTEYSQPVIKIIV